MYLISVDEEATYQCLAVDSIACIGFEKPVALKILLELAGSTRADPRLDSDAGNFHLRGSRLTMEYEPVPHRIAQNNQAESRTS